MLWLLPSQAGKTVGVPRGLLRFFALVMLSEKPMSGAEIAQQIEEETGGCWRPSCGSIYPLLAWMHNKGFTKAPLKSRQRFRRYSFTEKGKKFLNKQIEIGKELEISQALIDCSRKLERTALESKSKSNIDFG